jgi:hypothetical protein
MSTNVNSIFPFSKARLEEVQEAIGITQFPSATGWYQVIGGLIVQGGSIEVDTSATLAIPFHAPYEKQLLGVWLQVYGAAANNGYVSAPGLTSFQITNGVGVRTYYWLSLGV